MKRSFVTRLFGLSTLLLLSTAAQSSFAQAVPKLTSISREWLQRGTTNTVVFSGSNLRDAKSVVVSGDSGVSVKVVERPDLRKTVSLETSRGGISLADGSDGNRLEAEIVIEAGALLNERELRVVTATGVSNPVVLRVSPYPETVEPAAGVDASALTFPVGISGVIGTAGEEDTFKFQAKKGEELIFDVFAFRMNSQLDSSLALVNSAGQELLRSEDVKGFDSFLRFRVPEDGEYRLKLRDFRFGGGPKYEYHLTAGALPYVESVYPAGGARGQAVELTLRGANLAMDRMTVRSELDAPIGWQEMRIATSSGLSTPFAFHVGDLAEFLEKEPNGAGNQATSIMVPGVVNGRIGAAEDADLFKFKPSASQRLICEVTAQRFGSPLDAVLELRDASGKLLTQNDDAEGADARFEFNFEKDQEYTLSIRDLLERGGNNYIYRISLRPPTPTFAVRFFPDTPRLNCGGRTVVRCEISRQAGFNGAVRVTCEGLPAGVTCEPVLMTPDDPSSGLLVLTASDHAAGGAHPFKVVASGVIGGKQVARTAEPLSNDMAVREGLITVLESAPDYRLELVTLNLALEQDQSADLDVIVHRRNGFEREVKVTAEGFSSGREALTRNLEFQPLIVKASETHAKLRVKARMDSEIGSRPIYLKGEATVDGQSIVQFSPTIPLTIRELPFALQNTMKRLSIAVLPPGSQSAASEAEFAIRASRRGWFTDQINLTLEGLPEGVTATVTNLGSNIREVGFKLNSTEKAPAGKEFPIVILGTANVAGRTYQQRTEPMTLSITKPQDLAGTQ